MNGKINEAPKKNTIGLSLEKILVTISIWFIFGGISWYGEIAETVIVAGTETQCRLPFIYYFPYLPCRRELSCRKITNQTHYRKKLILLHYSILTQPILIANVCENSNKQNNWRTFHAIVSALKTCNRSCHVFLQFKLK